MLLQLGEPALIVSGHAMIEPTISESFENACDIVEGFFDLLVQAINALDDAGIGACVTYRDTIFEVSFACSGDHAVDLALYVELSGRIGPFDHGPEILAILGPDRRNSEAQTTVAKLNDEPVPLGEILQELANPACIPMELIDGRANKSFNRVEARNRLLQSLA